MTDAHREDLVALLHGELEPAAANELRARLAGDAGLRAEFEALRAADAALLAALEAPVRPPARTAWWRPLVAVAALLVVALVFVFAAGSREAAHNDVVGLRVRVSGGALQPVFTDVALEFDWQNRVANEGYFLAVEPYLFGETLGAKARRRAQEIEKLGNLVPLVPLVISAVLHAPDGQRIAARLADESMAIRDGETRRVPLHAFVIETEAPPPFLAGRPGDRQWKTMRPIQNEPTEGPRRFLLDQVGEWTIELRVESVPPPSPGLWPSFTEPLVVATKVIGTGLVSDWGEVHDGLQARLMLATGCVDLDHAPLVLQIRNVGDDARSYNVVGMTMADVPQPFHFELLTNTNGSATGSSRDLVARPLADDLPGFTFGPGDLFVPHPAGTTRSILVCADYWQGPSLADLEDGALRVDFTFKPTLVVDGKVDGAPVWQGKLSTGVLALPPRDRR